MRWRRRKGPRLHRDLLPFVLVGAGPTGVEMASAIAVLVRNTLRWEFRRIDPASARMVLVDQAPRVLGFCRAKRPVKQPSRFFEFLLANCVGHPGVASQEHVRA